MASKLSSKATGEIMNRVTDIRSEPLRFLPPIKGFEKEPLVSIDEAVESLTELVPDVEQMVWTVKKECKRRPPTHLTLDQRASIMLYTLEWSIHEESFYYIFNRTLRSANRQELKPWFRFLKLFIVALLRLPFIQAHIYRGIKANLAKEYPTGSDFVWWAFSSCTKTIEVLEAPTFLGRHGERTIFNIHCSSGIDIREHSFHQNENEILLLAARQFQVDSCADFGHGLHMIQVKEMPSPFPLLAEVSSYHSIHLFHFFSCLFSRLTNTLDRFQSHSSTQLQNHQQRKSTKANVVVSYTYCDLILRFEDESEGEAT